MKVHPMFLQMWPIEPRNPIPWISRDNFGGSLIPAGETPNWRQKSWLAPKIMPHLTNYSTSLPPCLGLMLGYMSLEMAQPKKSLTFFNLNIEYNPNSANAYDSLADYYMSQNDFDNALKNIKIALDISGDSKYKKRIEEIISKKNGQ